MDENEREEEEEEEEGVVMMVVVGRVLGASVVGREGDVVVDVIEGRGGV